MKLDLTHIALVLEGDCILANEVEIEHIAIDSRTVIPADELLFFCIRGKQHDAHHYIDDLINKGVINFVVDREYPIPDGSRANFIVVNNTLRALQKIAAWRRSNFHQKVIGITGSNGKTIVKEWLAQCLQAKYKLVRSPKSYNSQVGVPLSIWLLDNDSDLAIFEAGISHPGEMEKLENILKPEIGLFTNIGEPHQENFASLREKVKEKSKLFRNSQTIIYRSDYSLIDEILKSEYPGKELISWSTSKKAWLTISGISKADNGTSLSYLFDNENYEITIPFTDTASIENAIHVLAVLLYFNFNFEEIGSLLFNLVSVAMRLEQKKGMNNCVIINDTYNSDLNALTIALDFLDQQPGHLKRTVVLSDILQSGRPENELYQEVANLLSKRNIFRFIGIGKNLQIHKKYFDDHAHFFESTRDFINSFNLADLNNEAILLKGARPFRFETISALIEEKLHRTVFEINLDALVHNLIFYRSIVPPGTKMMVMLKAFSYGSGTYEIANVLQHHNVNYFGVAIADEGVFLRKNGIKTPIMVMNPDDSSFQLMTDYNLEPEIYNFEISKAFSDHVKRNGLVHYPVHLKIDTGMHRLGFLPDNVEELITWVTGEPGVHVKSVFSHLAASDEPGNDMFTRHQFEMYNKVCNQLKSALGYGFIRHILNSAGIERFPEAAMDMVRLGIGIYGSSSHRQKDLLTVGKLKTTIIQIKDVPPNETIGYSRKGKFKESKKIGIVPVGYADGLNRLLSNGIGYMMVRGEKAPIVGNVCMDMTMIDISNIPAKVNDEVVIFGEKPSLNEVAEKTETIPYEVLTGISQRVKRVYYRS
jgi:Alr-MurF fusion protein